MTIEALKELLNPLGMNFDSLTPGPTEEQKAELKHQSDKLYKLAIDFKKTFETPEGKRVLKHLREMTVENSTWLASMGLINGIANGFAREGQNSIIRYIDDKLKEAEARKVQQQKDKENEKSTRT